MKWSSVAVIGGGESGVGAAILAKKKGMIVFLSEFGTLNEKYKKEVIEYEIPFEEKGHSIDKLKEFDIIVKSPGVPDTVEIIQELSQNGKKIVSEIEFGFHFTKIPIIGITGSNGKTTTTGLVYHLLKEAGVKTLVGGNIGKSFARILAEAEECEVYVLEISSFQLDGIDEFRPSISILLNITPDHLDRYQYQFENYINSKLRIAKNQQKGDVFIYNGDDQSITKYFNFKDADFECVAVKKNQYKISLLLTDKGEKFDISNTNLKGRHNRFNALCAIHAVQRYGLNREQIMKGLQSFVNVPHRLEVVDTISGVEYINDSKATNVDAVYYALEAMEKPVVWIAGGTDKGNNYSPLMPLVREKVNHLICLGVDNEKLKSTFRDEFDYIFEAKSAEDAVRLAASLAFEEDVVLLSPACASFDLFKNYEDRGDQFKAAVKQLRIKN